MKLVDCDVHPLLPDGGASLEPYLPEAWRGKFAERSLALANPLPPARYSHPMGVPLRSDASPPTGGSPGSDPQHMVNDLLAKEDPDAVILLPTQGAGVGAWVDTGEATALASAFNDYFVANWLPVDSRFHLGMVVAPQDPLRAAEEIRRLASVERIAGVWVPLLDILAGNAHYHPIYAAAAETGLPILLHPNGTEAIYQGCPGFAGGLPSTYAERFVDLIQIGQSTLVSLIYEGVLERFPDLKFVFGEYGWSWLPTMLWRMDATWKATRSEIPWVKRPPSEYVRERIRFTTQPVDEPVGKTFIPAIAEMMFAADVLMFSSDYPHWDSEDVTHIMRVLPPETKDRVAYETATETYRLSVLTHA